MFTRPNRQVSTSAGDVVANVLADAGARPEPRLPASLRTDHFTGAAR